MAKRGDRTCFVCRKGYHYCLCHGGNPNETWRFLFCSDNCRSVEMVWEEYFRDNLITKADAVARLGELDTSRIEYYRDQIRDDIKSILPFKDTVSLGIAEIKSDNSVIDSENNIKNVIDLGTSESVNELPVVNSESDGAENKTYSE